MVGDATEGPTRLTESSHNAGRWRRGLFAAAGLAYLAAHPVAARWGSRAWWGVDAWGPLPPGWAYGPAAAGAALFLAPVQAAVAAGLRPLGRLAVRVPRAAWVLVAGVVFWALRQRVFLSGDGLLRLRNLTRHLEYGYRFPQVSTDEPLDTFLHSALSMLLHPFGGVTAQHVYQGVSIVAGMVAVLVIAGHVRSRFATPGARAAAVLGLLGVGSIQLWFGYVESYAVAWTCALAALLAAVAMVESRTFSRAAAVWFAFAAAFHPVTLALAPGIAAAYARTAGSVAPGRRRRAWAVLLLAVLAIWGFTAVLIRLGSASVASGLPSGASRFLPLLPAPDHGYAVLSWAHLRDVVNELLLLLPLLPVLLVPAGAPERRATPGSRVAAWALVGPLLMLLVIDPKLGFARDWDLFSLAALPAAVLAAERLTGLPERIRPRYVVPLAGLALLHLVPWILLNASPAESLARFRRLADSPSWSAAAQAMAHESLATVEAGRQRFVAAADEYAAAFRRTGNVRFYRNAVKACRIAGDAAALRRIVTSLPPRAEGYAGLGELCLEQGRPAEAVAPLERAVSLAPADAGLGLELGLALAATGHSADAVAAYTHALPQAKDADLRVLILVDRADARLALDEPEDAAADCRAALDLDPTSALAQFRLARASYRLGRYREARSALDAASWYGYPPDDVARLRKEIDDAAPPR